VRGTFAIARRFCGPTDSANGGYTCGTIASYADGPVTVRLLRPVPLATPLVVEDRPDGLLDVLHGETLVAQARPGDIGDLVPPPPPAYAEAVAASGRYFGFTRHPAPECFVCGPRRGADALRIFAGPLNTRGAAVTGSTVTTGSTAATEGTAPAPGIAAAPWTPDASLDAGDGAVAAPFVWAALDCPGFAAAAPDMRPMLLGELTARIERRPRMDEACIVVGWAVGTSGRKHEAGTALYGADGRLCAAARAIWIEPRTRAS